MVRLMDKKVCIVGGGLGGLATGSLLVRKGYTVEIFEKEKILGGRALTFNGNKLTLDEYQNILHRFDMWLPFAEPDIETIFERNMLHGYRFDLGFHLLGFASKSPITRILNAQNEPVNILSTRFGVIHPTEGVKSSLRNYLSNKDKAKLLPLAIRVLTARKTTIKDLQTISLQETIDKYCKGKIRDVVGIAGKLIATSNNLEKISTGESIRILEHWIKGARKGGNYPIGGSSSLSLAFSNTIRKNGGKIHLNNKVNRILIKDYKAKGIEIKGEKKHYDAVVSNLPVQDLFRIAPAQWFPNEYVKKIKSLEGTGSVCAYYAMKRIPAKYVDKPFAFVEQDLNIEGKDAAGVIDFITANPRSGLSPKNSHLVQAYIICSPKEAVNRKKVRILREVLDKKMEVLIPNFRNKLIFSLYPTSWHLDGVAKTIDNEKPKSTTPIKNLYLVGDCIKSTGIGMNCAVESAADLAFNF